MGKMHSGGKKNLVMEYYRKIDRTIIQFDFICDKDSNSIPYDEINELGGRVFIVAPYQRFARNIFDIYQLCRKNKYKIVHGYNNTVNVLSMFAAWLAKVPVRINESISMGHSHERKTLLKNVLKLFSRSFSTHFAANGEVCGCWQFGEKLYRESMISVFKTVIDVSENRFDEQLRNQCRYELGLNDQLVIGHIGRLTEQKNTLFLIDIFAEIVKQRPDAILLIIGDGNLREAMLRKMSEKQIENNVLYLGRREDITQFYNAMDCFLLPSLYEGLPLVGVEAQTCGLPVFFSTEIPIESNACNDLGHFIELKCSAKEWAEQVIKETEIAKAFRRDHSNEVRAAGFDAEQEAGRLLAYYKKLIATLE